MYRRPPASILEFWSSVEFFLRQLRQQEASGTKSGGGGFFAAIWADVDVLADFYFAGGDFGFSPSKLKRWPSTTKRT